jgi:hypothetical protein
MTAHHPPAGPVGAEASRRRTFAIISHPMRVFAHRLANAFDAAVELRPAAFTVARPPTTRPPLRCGACSASTSTPGATALLTPSSRAPTGSSEADHPELTLEPVLAWRPHLAGAHPAGFWPGGMCR